MRRLFSALLLACSLASGCQPAYAADVVPAGAQRFGAGLIRDAHFYWGLGAPLSTFFAQVHQESRWRANAQSPFAAGLSQFTPGTAADIVRMYPADFADVCKALEDCRFDPDWAIRAMVLYDRKLWRGFPEAADADNRLAFALASYNGGAGWMRREAADCAQQIDCDPRFYFSNVNGRCGHTLPARSPASCQQNRDYPQVILFRWRPLYQGWLARNALEEAQEVR